MVPNPSALFLSDRDLAPNVSSAVAGGWLGGQRWGGSRCQLGLDRAPQRVREPAGHAEAAGGRGQAHAHPNLPFSATSRALIVHPNRLPLLVPRPPPTVVLEGTRPLLMEVQALCSPVPQGSPAPPSRFPSGVNRQRLALLLAVLGKHTEMRPYSVDVHLNVTGGECGAAAAQGLPAQRGCWLVPGGCTLPVACCFCDQAFRQR